MYKEEGEADFDPTAAGHIRRKSKKKI
jgi:hypothetical protein